MKKGMAFLLSFCLLVLLLLVAATEILESSRPVMAGSSSSAIYFYLSSQSLGSDGYDITAGDLDGDLDLDAFVASTSADKVWINQGGDQGGAEGSFVDSGQSLGSAISNAVALEDFDDDGDLDAFVVDDGGTGVAWINQGGDQGGTAGQFLIGQAITETLASHVAFADLNGDMAPDAFIARNVGRPNKIWWNDGSGSFSDSGQELGSDSSTAVALGDLDGDGDIDAFVADGAANKVWINQGGIQGGSEGIFLVGGQSLGNTLSNTVALGDVDGDGDLDAYVGNINVSDVLWVNQGGDQGGTAGQFAASPQQLGPAGSREVKLLDLDDDGDLDAFVARAGGNQVWLNQGGDQGGSLGQFTNSGLNMGNDFSTAVDLADADGDGDPDAYVANTTPADNQIWINDTTGLPDAVFQVERQMNGEGKQVFYATTSQVALPIMLSQPFTQTLEIHSRIEAPGSVFTTTFPIAAGQQLKLLDLVADEPDPADEYQLTLFVTLPGGTPSPGVYSDRLSFFFVDANKGPVPDGCLLCFGEWLGRLLGFDPIFGALHHMDLAEQRTTAQWHYYTLLFDIHTPELSSMLASHPAILWELLDTLDHWTPAVQALSDGGGSSFTISQGMVNEAIGLMDGVKAEASPELKTALAYEQTAVDPSSFVGMNMDEAWAAVVTRRPVEDIYVTVFLQ